MTAVASPARRDGRMPLELAPVITTTLSLIPCMKFCFLSLQIQRSALAQLSTINTQLLPNHYRARTLPSKDIVPNSAARSGCDDIIRTIDGVKSDFAR